MRSAMVASMNITTYSHNGRDYLDTIDGLEVGVVMLPVDDYRPILDNLQEFERAERWPKGMRRMKLGRCFNNAISTFSLYGLPYAEGFVQPVRNCPYWIHHAWNLDADDRVIDRTFHGYRNLGYRYIGTTIEAKDLAEWVKKWERE